MTADQHITQAAAHAALARSNGDEVTEAYWTERVVRLSDERERMTAAERTVARLDGYTQEQHTAGIMAARERATKRASRRSRAATAAADALRRATFDELKGSPDHSGRLSESIARLERRG